MKPSADGKHVARPLPVIEPQSREYWEGAHQHRLVIQRCEECMTWVHPPRFTCPRCQSEALDGQEVSGKGTIYSFSIMHMPAGPGFDDGTPYVVAVVELAEQPGLITIGNVIDSDVNEVHSGMAVTVAFEDVTDEISLPQWRSKTS